MLAIRLHEFGPAENLRYEEVADPVPGEGQVRIQVEAAGVYLIDTMLRAGTAGGGPVAPPELPTIPGREVAGRVNAVGSGVDDEWIGKRVVVHLGPVPGGYAEQAVAKVESLHEIPDHLDAAAAVATIGTGRTAAGILEQAALSSDDLMNRGLSATWAIGPKLMRKLRTLETAALRESTEGRWIPLTTSFPLSKAADAHRALENRETTGKVVLIP